MQAAETRVPQAGNPGSSTTKLSTLDSVDSSPVSVKLAIGRILVSTFVRLFKLMSILVQVEKKTQISHAVHRRQNIWGEGGGRGGAEGTPPTTHIHTHTFP